MKLSKRTFLMLFAMIVLMIRMPGGDQFIPPPPDIPDPEMPMPGDPTDPFTDGFDPNDIPLPDIPDFPPEIEFPPFPPDDLIPIPDPPFGEDPFPDLEPSLFPGLTLADFDPVSPPGKTNALGPSPRAVAINTVTPLIEFPRRIWFSPHVSTAGSGPGTPLNCSPQFQNRLLVPESKANSVAVLNTCPVGRSGRIPVGKKPIAVVTAPDGQSALVSNVNDATISVINLRTLAVSQTISLPPFNGAPMRPSGIAILPDGSKAYVANHVAFAGSVVYVIDLNTMKFTGTMLSVGDFPASIAATPDGSQVWVSSWGSGRVDVFDVLTNVGVAAFNVPSPNGIAFNPSGTRAYVASSGSNAVFVLDTSTYQVITQIPVGALPHAVLVSATGRHLFVTNAISNSMSLIDTGSNKVLRTISLKGKHPLGLAFVAKSPF